MIKLRPAQFKCRALRPRDHWFASSVGICGSRCRTGTWRNSSLNEICRRTTPRFGGACSATSRLGQFQLLRPGWCLNPALRPRRIVHVPVAAASRGMEIRILNVIAGREPSRFIITECTTRWSARWWEHWSSSSPSWLCGTDCNGEPQRESVLPSSTAAVIPTSRWPSCATHQGHDTLIVGADSNRHLAVSSQIDAAASRSVLTRLWQVPLVLPETPMPRSWRRTPATTSL